ncbi:MAG: KilA-N domain-containing protein [Prevotellaceae bacterium]|jgi:hypothetical protein|nr:KilA-N domain-containing protein [Prevotellaceae bacterium]
MGKKETITVQGTAITVITSKDDDYISLTDMANVKAGQARTADVIKNWIRTRTTLEFLGTWEQLYNPDFKVVEFDHFKMQAGLPSFVLSAGEWILKTNAIGIYVKHGRYGGTYAHKDIAFEFGSAISVVFRLFLIKEFQRLKEDEQRTKSLEWNLQRTLSKINYRIHTDAIKEHIIPNIVTKEQIAYTYAEEADLLNVALFGKTAAQWRSENPGTKGNIRDYATLEQLVVLSNMESINALLIRQELPQNQRLVELNKVAITQMRSLVENKGLKRLQ